MNATNYFERLALNTLCGVTAAGISKLYASLLLADPTETGTQGTEASYTGYARVQVIFSAPALNAGNLQIVNTAALTWAKPDVDVGDVKYLGIHDSVTGGNMLLYGEFVTPLTLRSGQEPTQRQGDIVFYETGNLSDSFMTQVFNILRNVSMTAKTPYAAMFSALPSAGGVELSGAAYARKPVTFSSPAEIASGHSQVKNSSEIVMPTPIASWGTWGADVLMDAATGGNIIVATAVSIPESITENIVVNYEPGDITVSLH